jgi:hypothetical protein
MLLTSAHSFLLLRRSFSVDYQLAATGVATFYMGGSCKAVWSCTLWFNFFYISENLSIHFQYSVKSVTFKSVHHACKIHTVGHIVVLSVSDRRVCCLKRLDRFLIQCVLCILRLWSNHLLLHWWMGLFLVYSTTMMELRFSLWTVPISNSVVSVGCYPSTFLWSDRYCPTYHLLLVRQPSLIKR